MKTILYIYILGFLSFTPFNSIAQKNSETIDLQSFDFLIGKWQANFDKFIYFEVWEKTLGGYSGKGYRVKEGNRFDGEKLLLMNIHGYISYIATIGQQQPILFALVETSQETYMFENKEHDFPQRIIYEYISSDSIKVIVEGESKDKIIKDEYSLSRIHE